MVSGLCIDLISASFFLRYSRAASSCCLNFSTNRSDNIFYSIKDFSYLFWFSYSIFLFLRIASSDYALFKISYFLFCLAYYSILLISYNYLFTIYFSFSATSFNFMSRFFYNYFLALAIWLTNFNLYSSFTRLDFLSGYVNYYILLSISFRFFYKLFLRWRICIIQRNTFSASIFDRLPLLFWMISLVYLMWNLPVFIFSS